MATTRAAQQIAQAKAEYDAFLTTCPSHKLVERISGKWVVLILAALGSGPDCAGDPRPMRYSELSRLLAGVSQKMLTQTLRSLERDGLISRTVIPTVPVTVSYELTDLGLSLFRTMRGLKQWAQTHMDEVFAHRTMSLTRSARSGGRQAFPRSA
ncbi:helix-turn-helix domain-containing protein [Plantactinospora sp. B24E8]|uniref:winged helix-turn-helix transcriptional regulator n=1 Tax=Plantactinospora sp. B24E8 TaxID=3153567 RepID=UPI00325EB7C1